MHRLERSIILKADLKKVWDFFSNPNNLALITPTELNFKIVNPVPNRIYPGMFILYKVHPLLGIPLTWLTEITQVKEQHYFIDEQRMGPYRIWHHQHFFSEVAGGIEVRDIVDYLLPFGILGKIAHELHVKRQLNEIFDFREKVLDQYF